MRPTTEKNGFKFSLEFRWVSTRASQKTLCLYFWKMFPINFAKKRRGKEKEKREGKSRVNYELGNLLRKKTNQILNYPNQFFEKFHFPENLRAWSSPRSIQERSMLCFPLQRNCEKEWKEKKRKKELKKKNIFEKPLLMQNWNKPWVFWSKILTKASRRDNKSRVTPSWSAIAAIFSSLSEVSTLGCLTLMRIPSSSSSSGSSSCSSSSPIGDDFVKILVCFGLLPMERRKEGYWPAFHFLRVTSTRSGKFPCEFSQRQ